MFKMGRSALEKPDVLIRASTSLVPSVLLSSLYKQRSGQNLCLSFPLFPYHPHNSFSSRTFSSSLCLSYFLFTSFSLPLSLSPSLSLSTSLSQFLQCHSNSKLPTEELLKHANTPTPTFFHNTFNQNVLSVCCFRRAFGIGHVVLFACVFCLISVCLCVCVCVCVYTCVCASEM